LFSCLLEYFESLYSTLKPIAEIEEELTKYNISYTKNYTLLSFNGYSQGDYCTVFINTKEFNDTTGAIFDPEVYKKILYNYIYDVPLSCYVNINDTEFYSVKFDGSYNIQYDKYIFITELLENFKGLDQDKLRKELENILPVEPTHIY
jgi:hypothetical protein